MRLSSLSILLSSLLLMTACTSLAPMTPLPGANKEQVVARMGQPDVQRQLDGGSTRLE